MSTPSTPTSSRSPPTPSDSDIEVDEDFTTESSDVQNEILAPPVVLDPRAKLGPQQLQKLDEIRKHVLLNKLTEKEIKFCDDACLLRYLRARDWNVQKSYKLLIGTLEWRRHYKPDSINPRDLDFEASSGKMFRFGTDLVGRPVIYMNPAKENSKDYEKNLKLIVYTMEAAVRSMPPNVEQLIWVVDFEGYSPKSAPPISVAKEVLSILSNHYPERLGFALLLDAPKIFSLFYSAIKGFINSVTRKKVIFCNGKSEEKLKIVSKLFDLPSTPTRLGGTHPFTYDHSSFWPQEVQEYESMVKNQ